MHCDTGQVKKGDKRGHAHSRLGAEYDEKRWGKGISARSGQCQGHVGPVPLGNSEYREDGVREVGWKGPLDRGHILCVL